jgi:general secretion pathway protein D
MQDLTQQGTGRNNQRFQGAAGGQTAQSGGGSESTGLDEETYFEADPNTNTLLIMTSTKNYEKIKPIIDDLDKPVGQVLIKVLFAEVTHTKSVDLGTEFSSLNLTGDNETTLSFGRQSPVSDMVTTTTLTGSLNMTLEALQQTGRLNVLSRPYILASNNQMATITVAQEIPIPTGSTTVAGQTQVTFDYRTDIGIVLEVTPSINPEGLVNMTITPKITTRTNETLTIAAGVDAEAFATRSATTKVAVLNGQTIVIGGLIEDQLTDTVKKVPLLGDLPLLGPLFQHKSNENAKTELLIFLTPMVATEANQLVPISDLERKRSNIYTDESAAAVFQKHLEAMDSHPTGIVDDANDLEN